MGLWDVNMGLMRVQGNDNELEGCDESVIVGDYVLGDQGVIGGEVNEESNNEIFLIIFLLWYQ